MLAHFPRLSSSVRPGATVKPVQPRKGRYFPVTPAEAWAEARRCGLVGEELEGDTKLLFANPEHAWSRGTPLVQLEGGGEIRIFSVAERLDPKKGRRAMLRAFELAAPHRDTAARWTRLKQVSLLVVLTEDDRLMVVVQTRWYQERKYRGTAKFSTAFKMRKVKTQEQSLGTYAL